MSEALTGARYLFAQPWSARGPESPVLVTPLTLARQDTHNEGLQLTYPRFLGE